MISKKLHEKIYKDTVAILEKKQMGRKELIASLLERSSLSAEEMEDNSLNGAKNVYRSRAGEIVSEMLSAGMIEESSGGLYALKYDKPAVIRAESCEREILRLISKAPITKQQINRTLASIFGTDKTPTKRDDGRLTEFINRTLKRLTQASVISYDGTCYSLSPSAVARADDISELMNLKGEFLNRIHAKGGEFFERYFMNLLTVYLKKHGKLIKDCYTTGGVNDGGIDGIVRTIDSLGFRETVMVQTKNRSIMVTETDIRGFYGAVCASRGTRGIYATTSVFHQGAATFLNAIDECIGIDGDKLFAMAVECLYGISRVSGKLKIDHKVI